MNRLSVISFAMTHRVFSRGLHKLTRMVTFAGLAISGIWGAWAWYWDQPDPLFRVIEFNSCRRAHGAGLYCLRFRFAVPRAGVRGGECHQVALEACKLLPGTAVSALQLAPVA